MITMCFINHLQKPVKVCITAEHRAEAIVDAFLDKYSEINIRYVEEHELHFTDPVEYDIIERTSREKIGTLTCDKEIVIIDL